MRLLHMLTFSLAALFRSLALDNGVKKISRAIMMNILAFVVVFADASAASVLRCSVALAWQASELVNSVA